MEQTKVFTMEDNGILFRVNVRFHLNPQGKMPVNCHRCWENHNGFIRDIIGIEIYDANGTGSIRNEGLQNRIASIVGKEKMFDPLCGKCLEKELEADLEEMIERFSGKEEEKQ